MHAINAKIATACLNGTFNKDGFLQGLLLQCLQRLEKEERGIRTLRGRRGNELVGERSLIEDAALTLAISGGNKAVCKELGQRSTAVRIQTEDLPRLSLPNPTLALLKGNEEQLKENVTLIDQRFARMPGENKRRLMMAVDATYLQKGLVQMKMGDRAGLVGGGWSIEDEAGAFLPLADLDKVERPEKASQMMEFLLWNPHMPGVRETYSLASVPTRLAATMTDATASKTHAGNLESRV